MLECKIFRQEKLKAGNYGGVLTVLGLAWAMLRLETQITRQTPGIAQQFGRLVGARIASESYGQE